jgi:hypothetical protein
VDDWPISTTSLPNAFGVGVKVIGLAPNTKKPRAAPATIANPSQIENVMKTNISK